MKQKNAFLKRWVSKAYLWATELLYHRLAWAYDFVAWLVSFGRWSQWRLDAAAYLQPGNILEIGFGTGELLIELASRGHAVTGLEYSPEMQRVTGWKLEREGISVRRVRARAEAMPFPSGHFSNIIVTFPTNYILQEDTLNEIHRALKKEGRLIVTGLTVRFKSGIRQWLTGWFLGGAFNEVLAHMRTRAEQAGLQVDMVMHETEDYVLPILILEPKND